MDVDQDINLLSSFTAYLSNLSSVEDITEEECNKYVKGITSKNIQLVQLVENLGPFLLHLDNDKREQGCLVLANILTLLPQDALSSMEVTFIARFLCERMKDHHSVIPAALKGTLAIAKMKNVDNGIAAEFFSTAFIHFYCQSQRHDDRNTFYQIICCFMDTKTPELLAMGTDFVYGVISSMDGEKDPRNLMLLFTKLVPKFVTTFKLGHLTEETFEVLGCYFPVDFQPLSNDPAAITRVDLASALQPCLVAHPEFAEFAVPLALEKLVSSLPVAKADSLKLLIDSCAKFPAANLMSHVTMIWHTLRSEILTCVGDPELRDLCFKVLYSLVQNLSCSALDSDQMAIYNGLLNDIFLSMKGYLSDLSLSLFNPICKLLETVASASHSSCSFMLLKIVPVLTALTPKSSAESVTLLKVMSAFLLVCFQTQVLPEDWRQLQNDSNKIVTLYLSALSSNNEEEVLEGAEGFIVILSLLSEEERAQFYSAIRNLLQKDSSSLPRIQILKCIKAAARHYPEEVLNQLVEGTLQPNHGSEITTQEKGLTVLCYLADQEPFFSHLYTHIKSITDTPSREGIGIFLSCFKNLAEVENIILPKSSTVIFALISGVLQMDCADDNFFKLLENFYHVASALMLHLNESDEAKLVIHFLPILLNEVERSTPGAESREIKILFLLSSLLTRIRMPVDKSTTSTILKFCADLIFHATNEEVILHAARLIALLVNKASEPDANLKLEQIQNYLLDKENSGNVSAEVDVAFLCKKALPHRMDSQSLAQSKSRKC
ncbi:unnamed protein product [Bemisia tabaci]|uniref:MMS19 nucleotide excision repair protein n=1 Tax=Bemisia tabaci TaxID=7038 RepID=A0A9P0F6K2_BEMTA|nr:unnamed protein product [Bemisia tabaci]